MTKTATIDATLTARTAARLTGSTMIALAAALAATAPAQAAVVLDQDALVTATPTHPVALATRVGENVRPGVAPFTLSLVQTATAGVSGYLDHIDLQVSRGAGDGFLYVGVFDGDFGSGSAALIDYQAIPYPALAPSINGVLGQAGMLSVDVRWADLFLDAGDRFSIGLTFVPLQPASYALALVGTGPMPPVVGTPTFNYHAYAGGEMLVYVNGSQVTGTPLNNGELGFRSYMDTVPGSAVPEPASWAMLIAGFALAGGALRQRHARLVRLQAAIG